MGEKLTLRVRSQVGMWRVQADTTETVGQIISRIETERSTDLTGRPLSRKIGDIEEILDAEKLIGELGLANGDILHLDVDREKTSVTAAAAHVGGGMKITKDGNIVATSDGTQKNGFRPGMMPLRNMKMQWRLDEFLALDEQFVFNFTGMQKQKAFCEQVSLETDSMKDLTQYMYMFDYKKLRVAFLYGHFTDGNKVRVECIYEPPQECTDTEFELLQDDKEEKVEVLANSLGLTRVGWLIVHPPREKDFIMSGMEALTAAELQLDAAKGVNDTCFITVMATLRQTNMETDDSKPARLEWTPAVDAFQTHKLCMEMVAENALDVHPTDPGFTRVHETFTARAEGRDLKDVPTQLMVAPVPIVQASSETFVSMFPKANREGVVQTRNDLKKQLEKAGKEGWTEKDLLRDFHLLLFLCDLLTLHDMPALCQSLLDPEGRLEDGNLLLIRSIAGFDM